MLQQNEAHMSSPRNRGSQDYKQHTFKSPTTSAQKKRFPKSKSNNENFDSEQHPFSGPTFVPMNFNRGKTSPSPFTPIKIKEEYILGDFTGNSKDFNMLPRPFESPFGASTKDLALSPCVYKFTSPGALFLRSQSNNNHGGFQNNAYASFFDFNVGSPTFARKNVTRLDFNNPSNKFITFKSHKDEVNVEYDDHNTDYLEFQKDVDGKHFAFPSTYDETPMQSTQLKFPAKKTIYTGSMISSQHRADDHYSHSHRIPQDSTNRKEPRYFAYADHYDEDADTLNPRTPSPTANLNSKIKLESINSFSAQQNGLDTTATRKGMGSDEYSNSQNSTVKVNDGHGEDDDEHHSEEAYCNMKSAKKKVCCNCKKSRCLKLYCDCFNRGQPCVGECNCVNCLNTVAHTKEREEAMRAVLERNPSAFKPKVDQTASPEKVEENTEQGRVRHIRGCNCKKSGCQKKYCECYQAGVKCTELCKCEHCKNMDSCCRLKRAKNYGFVNFGLEDNMSISIPYTEAKNMKHYSKHARKNLEYYPSPEEDDNSTYYTGSRSQLMHSNPDPSFYSDVPLQKKRKLDVTVSEFTPKRTLVFVKEEHKTMEDFEEGQYTMLIHREKKNGMESFKAAYAQADKKKRMTKIEESAEYDPNPIERRSKRNVKPFSQFNSDEYELGK